MGIKKATNHIQIFLYSFIVNNPFQDESPTMHTESYRLAEVLAVANIHPFYNPGVQYPPGHDAIQYARRSASKPATEVDLRTRPMVTKKDLYIYHSPVVYLPLTCYL
ncbi:uncharacterized protein EURHEDRAFT_409819 [Aspergillus ruber CBS 135680]|uniref:Uncharacterized protein n=1 Tax=Aspergillus ruber (strain CBS 135680) TaxID=1388766 RepID=A0A017SKW3_ASPRC|nr:uncharacterized protein EURHEDRAFT_409819 [Aspergillus ruber CBS 135680]EYE97593.1 hypothetical protein EURHEDRAFT_409819 [Aspergillus ruber CBS 135680]